MSVPPRRLRPLLAIALGLGLGLSLALTGCDQPTAESRAREEAAARAARGVNVAADPVEPAPPAPAKVAPRPILGQKTQDIRDVEAEKKAGGVVTPPRITAKDPIRLVGNAYVTAISQTAINNMKHAIDLYQAETGEFPKTYEEFMEKIIKANNIVLPTLPFYQKYAYDAAEHKLVVMEYEDLKTQNNYPK